MCLFSPTSKNVVCVKSFKKHKQKTHIITVAFCKLVNLTLQLLLHLQSTLQPNPTQATAFYAVFELHLLSLMHAN